MKITKSRVAIGAAVAASTGLAAAAAAGALSLRRWRRRPDPVRGEDFSELPGTIHRMLAAHDGGEIHVVERGQGRPFFLIHGVTATTLTWHYQFLDLVEAGYRVVAMDIRGHGRSRAGQDGHTLGAMAQDAYDVIHTLDLRDAVVVGHSMGGMVVLQLAADHPELGASGALSGLALVATSASPVIGNGVPAAAAEMVRVLTPTAAEGHIRASAGRTDQGLPPRDLATVYCRLAFGANPSPTHVEMLRAMTSGVPALVLGELLQTLLNLDVRKALPSITEPVLVVVGTRDLLTPVRHSRYLVNHLPVAQLHVLSGSGHMVMLERRAELARLLIDFARRTAPVPTATAPVPTAAAPGL